MHCLFNNWFFIGWGRVPGLRNHVKSEKCQISLLRWRSKQQARPQLAESLHGKCVKSSAQIHKDFLDTHLMVLIFFSQWGIVTNFVLLSTSVRIEFEMEQIYADRHSRHKVVTVIFIIIIMIIIVISILVIIAFWKIRWKLMSLFAINNFCC